MSILQNILQEKHREISAASAKRSLTETRALAQESSLKPRGFIQAVTSAPFPSIIAEVKKASPSKGIIRADFHPVEIARRYALGGAAALSVLTDEKFFQGHAEFIPQIRSAIPLQPVLRKDFIINPYQVWETRLLGADALLLIVCALEDQMLEILLHEAHAAELDVLLEAHTKEDIERTAELLLKLPSHVPAPLIGINNRDLHTFHTDLAVTETLIPLLRSRTADFGQNLHFVAESGIFTGGDLRRLHDAGASAFLVGESLMKEADVGEALKKLRQSAT